MLSRLQFFNQLFLVTVAFCVVLLNPSGASAKWLMSHSCDDEDDDDDDHDDDDDDDDDDEPPFA